ncbi:MAG: response regulator [Acetobacteraceae bacterium]
MPARVVVVHDDQQFIRATVTALEAAGYDVSSFTDTMSALDALQDAQRFDVLVTRVRFGPGQPNGVALARMAKLQRPTIRILFAALPDTQEFTEGLGDFLAAPVDPDDLVRAVTAALSPG